MRERERSGEYQGYHRKKKEHKDVLESRVAEFWPQNKALIEMKTRKGFDIVIDYRSDYFAI